MPTIKTIDDFIVAVHTALSAAFPECCVEITSVTKNNGVCRNGITVQKKNQTVVPAFYMEPYFEEIQSGKTLEEVIRQIISSYAAALSYTETGIYADAITDFEHIKDNICYKLVNKQLNSKLLQKCRTGITTDLPLSTISGMLLRKDF